MSRVSRRVPYFVRSSAIGKSAEKYVVVKGSIGAGLGDKIRALAVGFLLAKITGRALWVDWDDRTYGETVGNLFPMLFSVSGLTTIDACPDVVTARPDIWTGRLGTSQAQLRADDLHARGIFWTGAAPPWDPQDAMRRYSWDAADLCDQADAVVITTMLSAAPVLVALRREGVLPESGDDTYVLQQCLRDHLRLSTAVGEQVMEFIGTNQWHENFVIGVHVRHSHESSAARTMPSMSQYFTAVDRALSGRSNSRIFLSTDNSDVIQLFRGHYGHDRVIVTDKWFAAPGESLHKNPHCPDGIGSAREAVVDMALLATCDFLISLGNSSFSIVANALSIASQEQRTILFPRDRFWRRVRVYLTQGKRC